MKKLLIGGILLAEGLCLQGQTNGFSIGIWGHQGLLKKDVNGNYYNTPLDNNGAYSSCYNVLAEDGFNLVFYPYPNSESDANLNLRYIDYENIILLGEANNHMKFGDAPTLWFRPTNNTGRTYNVGPLHTGIEQYDDGLSSTPNTNAITYNYNALLAFIQTAKDQNGTPLNLGQYIYNHDIGGELNNFHYFPLRNTTSPLVPSNYVRCDKSWCDYLGGHVAPDGDPNFYDDCEGSSTNPQKGVMAEVPAQNLSNAVGHFKSFSNVGKISWAAATHNTSMEFWDAHLDYPYRTGSTTGMPPYNAATPCTTNYAYNGAYLSQSYFTYNDGIFNHPDLVRDAGYYTGGIFWTWINTDASAKLYLGKFSNIDYMHLQGFNHITSENDIALELGSTDQHHVHSYPTIPNANFIRFLNYTSVIHGVDGVQFYTLTGEYGFDSGDAARWSAMSAGDFQRTNFPYLYQNSISTLARELRYLAEKNLIAPYGTTGNAVIHKKTTLADDWKILPACSTYLNVSPYIANVGVNPDFRDLNQILIDNNIYGDHSGIPSSMTANPHASDEYFGLRYTVNTNSSGETIIIVSNPNPHAIHNVKFDFTDPSSKFSAAFTTVVNTTKAIDVWFDDGSVTDVNALNYKVTTTPSVDNVYVTLGNRLIKKYSLPFCNKAFYSDFGPFDVKIFKFNTTSYEGNNNTAFTTSGWQKKWGNNGDGTIGAIWGGPGNLASTDRFIPIDFDGNGDEELLCVQSKNSDGPSGPNPDAWATILNWNGTSSNWTSVWTNNGNGSFDNSGFAGWGISTADKYYVGDFDGDTKDNDLLCINGAWATVLHSNGTNFVWYWSNSGNGYLANIVWSLAAGDKVQFGDFNGDGLNNDLLCVRNSTGGQWAILHCNPNPGSNISGIGSGSGNLFGNINWPISTSDEYFVGDFDGAGSANGNGRNEVLCLLRGARACMLKKDATGYTLEWLNSGGTTPNFPAWTVTSTDKVLVGDVDASDIKDEMMFIQTGATATNAVTEDLNSSLAPQCNWSNHSTTFPQGTQNYIGDWLLKDACSSDAKYLFIKADVNATTNPGMKKYLLAFKNYQNNTYLISMYKANGAYNYRQIEPEQVDTKPSVSGFDFNLFPNPNNGSFTISCDNTNEKKIMVTDVVGRIISESTSLEREVNLTLPEGAKGIYFVKLVDGNRTGVKKIIVE